jgi:hypothetical protein
VDHIALRVPMLVLTVTIDLDKLLQDRGPATGTFDGITKRVVVMTIDFPLVLIVRVLRTKDSWANRTSEMLNMILAVKRSDIRAPERTSTGLAHKVQAPEIVALTERILLAVWLGDGEELGGDNLATVLVRGRRGWGREEIGCLWMNILHSSACNPMVYNTNQIWPCLPCI